VLHRLDKSIPRAIRGWTSYGTQFIHYFRVTEVKVIESNKSFVTRLMQLKEESRFCEGGPVVKDSQGRHDEGNVYGSVDVDLVG
jgi:phospholipid N-methyltransferase